MFIFYIICFFCFLEGCEEKREMGLSYKEVGTEVFLLDGDEEKSVLALDVAANLDTIDWFFRDKHNYLQPSVFFYINNRTCETLSVYVCIACCISWARTDLTSSVRKMFITILLSGWR